MLTSIYLKPRRKPHYEILANWFWNAQTYPVIRYSDKDILKNNLEKTDIATCLNM